MCEKELEDGGDVVTILDYIEKEKELEQDANAVLGASDFQNCTYSQGYVKRQALYSCLTCIPNDGNHLAKNYDNCAGICVACSFSCHEGHELVELYTKRNFRCDCGNSKFADEFKCNLVQKDKKERNVDNKYNHNFYGYYCSCDRTYPDANDSVIDEMIQCIVCEDWYHKRHLAKGSCENESDKEVLDDERQNADTDVGDVDGTNVNADSDQSFSELICHFCIEKNPFLLHYEQSSSKKTPENDEQNLDKNECKLNGIEKGANGTSKSGRAIFFSGDWRSALCLCAKCKQLYSDRQLNFLTDLQDTIESYEEKGRNNSRKSQYEEGLNAFMSMNGTQQRNMMFEYNDMVSNLTGYLRKFAESRKVVRAEDIQEFFSEMKNKKRRLDNADF